MRNDLFTHKARWACTWSVLLIVWLSTTPWLMRSRAVLAQATNEPGTPPEILGFNVSRTALSHGRVENARQQTPINPNGLRDVQGFGDPTTGRPGLLTTIANPSPAWQPDSLHITMGWDPNFSKEPLGIGASATNPITLAAAGIPSCFTLIVAEGVAPAFSNLPGRIPNGVRWESTGPLIGQGNLYASVSIPAAGIVAGMELRTEEQLAAYTANSIIWEAPPFGQVVQDSLLMQFGTKNISAHALERSDASNPVMGPAYMTRVEVTRTLHVEIEVLGITQNHDGTFRLCAIANLFGNSLEPVTSFWFRWGFDGQTVDLVGDIRGTNMVTIPRIPAAEKDQLAELYVVASCNGSLLTGNPFTAEPLGVPADVFVRKDIGLLTFVSGGCTLEDDQSVKMTPFGRCPRARATITSMSRTGAAPAGGTGRWIRTTVAQGEVVDQNSGELAIAGSSVTFREAGPAGEDFSNTVTWTPPPEIMADEPWIDKPTMFPTSIDDCTYKGQASSTGNKGAQIGFWAYFDGPVDNIRGERIPNDGWPSSDKEGTPVGVVRSVTMGFRFPSPTKFKTLHSTSRYANGPDPAPKSPAPPDRASRPVVDLYYVISAYRGYWRNDRYQGERIVPEPQMKLRWRYEYSSDETLATVIRDGQELEAQEGMELYEADRVRTASNCSLAVGISGDDQSLLATLGAAEATEFDILLLGLGKPNRFDFALQSGEIRSEVFGERGLTQFRVITPAATATVAGTIFTTGYEAREQASRVAVEQGAVLVTPTNTELQPVTVTAGQQVKVTQNRVGPVTASSTSYFGGVTDKLLYIGIGAAMLVFIVLSTFIVSRAKRRAATGGTARRDRPAGPPATPSSEPPPPPVGQAVCDRCGAPLKPGKPFCTACGAPQRPAGASGAGTGRGSALEGGLPGSTTPIPPLCSNPQCRKPLVPGKWFCTKCGAPVR